MPRGVYGERLARVARLEQAPSVRVQILQKAEFAATRLYCHARRADGMTEPTPREDAFLVSLNLRESPAYDYWVGGRPVAAEPLRIGSTNLIDLNVHHVANLREPFDSLLMYVSRASLQQLSESEGLPEVESLNLAPGRLVDDSVIANLGATLLPALEQPERANRVFLEHVAIALQVHLVQQYGGVRPAEPRRGALSPEDERRVKDLLMSRIDGDVSIAALASECGLSRSHFIRAFKASTGRPPYRWLAERRLLAARELLVGSKLSIAEITQRLGYVNQSHLTRAFAKAYGVTPGALRRQRKRH
ncbi:MAG: AraC family transcriptional regulator [Myxococcota bacterium]|jgi:AraC family transcriptional regulator|nr:AraC family transcriptional regulator [Myxococcota bacterium]